MLRWLPMVLAAGAMLGLTAPGLARSSPQNAPTPAQNVRQSHQYEAAIRSSAAFRKRRIQEECGPITDPGLHAQCVSSFAGGGAPSGAHHPPPSETVR